MDNARALNPEDIAILFSPRDTLDRRIAARRIHEYHSLATGRLAWVKERVATSRLVPEPHGLIVQDGPSRDRLGPRLPTAPPRFHRPMGIDAALFDCARGAGRTPEFDLVYCGSLDRAGLAPTIEMLARRAFRLLCVGAVPDGFPAAALERMGVRFTGPAQREEIPRHLANARAGLNWMPDQFPLNVQESTKTVEYVAAGLPTVSNRYAWATAFAAQPGAAIHWMDDVVSPDDLDRLAAPTLDLADREWFAMLGRLGFLAFIDAVSSL